MKSLLDLEPRECRWPVHSEGDQHLFCADPSVPKKSYCAHHLRMAYMPVTADLSDAALGLMADRLAGGRYQSRRYRAGDPGSHAQDLVATLRSVGTNDRRFREAMKFGSAA